MLNVKLRIMKKKNLLKFLFMALMGIMSVNAFGQAIPTDLAEDTDGSAVDHVTEGYRIPYYVTPDEVLNSTFSEPYVIGTEVQGFNSGWNWSINMENTNGDGSATGTIHNAGYDETNSVEYGWDHPYVEVEWTRVTDPVESGEQAYIEVMETSQAGSCTGNWKWLSVQVYAAPEFTFTDGTNGGTDQETADASGEIELCDDGTGITRDILIANIPNNGIPNGSGEAFENGNFKFRLDKDVNTIDSEGNLVGTTNPQSQDIDDVVSVPLSFGNSVVLYSSMDLSALDGTGDGKADITRYRFDFGSTIDGTNQNGITDPVQRKSQYLTNPSATDADWDYIANTGGNADMLTIITYPAPETGNIHYVPNDFNL